MLTEQLINAVQKGGMSALQELGRREDIDGGDTVEMAQAKYDTAVENFEMTKMLHDVFSSGAGAKVLDFYRKRTLNRVQFNPEAVNPSETGFFRSGEANIVLHIIRGMEAAEKGPPDLPAILREPEGDEDV